MFTILSGPSGQFRSPRGTGSTSFHDFTGPPILPRSSEPGLSENEINHAS